MAGSRRRLQLLHKVNQEEISGDRRGSRGDVRRCEEMVHLHKVNQRRVVGREEREEGRRMLAHAPVGRVPAARRDFKYDVGQVVEGARVLVGDRLLLGEEHLRPRSGEIMGGDG